MNATTSEPVFLDLGATRTYARRRALWFAGVGELPRLGTLRVIQDRARKSGDSSDVCEYGVEPDTDPQPPGVRAWILKNDSPDDGDPERREFYVVRVCEKGTAGCTCTGTHTGRIKPGGCKHAACVLQLLSVGAL